MGPPVAGRHCNVCSPDPNPGPAPVQENQRLGWLETIGWATALEPEYAALLVLRNDLRLKAELERSDERRTHEEARRRAAEKKARECQMQAAELEAELHALQAPPHCSPLHSCEAKRCACRSSGNSRDNQQQRFTSLPSSPTAALRT